MTCYHLIGICAVLLSERSLHSSYFDSFGKRRVIIALEKTRREMLMEDSDGLCE